MQFIKTIFRRPRYIILILVILFAAWGAYSYYGRTEEHPYELAVVSRGDIRQEVSITGRVKPAQAVDLAFEMSGKVSSAAVKVGQAVKAGQTLAYLSNYDLASQLEQARANLEREQVKLEQLKAGARAEDIRIAQTNVANSQRSLAEAESKAETDLANVYSGVRGVIADAYNMADDALNKQSADLFNNRLINPSLTFFTSSQQKTDAEYGMVSGQAALNEIRAILNSLGTSQDSLDGALASVELKMKIVQNSLNYFSGALNYALDHSILSTYKYNVNLGRNNVAAALTGISGKIQAIAAQKAANASNITAARNSLAAAQDQLSLKLAGSAEQDIQSQEAQVRYARANVDGYAAQLSKTVLRSPISGVVTRQDLKVGQIVNANTKIISIMSAAQFEIEANVPEADIAKVKPGDAAQVTLDTYGNSVIFEAAVVEVEPAETLIEGVATYKTIFQFTAEDERIKSGMTANIDILTAQKSGVLLIPQRAMIQRGNERFVMLDAGGGQLREQKIEIGLKGSDGSVEVMAGLEEGALISALGEIEK